MTFSSDGCDRGTRVSAPEQVDRLIDPALPPEERERSKRRLIKGPGEFRDIRDRGRSKREK